MEATDIRSDPRARIIDVAARLLQENGRAAVTTRGVAHGAGVQAPTIYRLFGDKDGLLEAVAEHVMATYVSAKAAIVESASAENIDPLDDLRAGWETQIDFGLANPDLFRLLSDASKVVTSPAIQAGKEVLQSRVHRLAVAGRLRVSEQRAADLIQAAGIGTVQLLLSQPTNRRDPGLGEASFEAVLGQILSDELAIDRGGLLPTTIAFRAIAPELDMLSDAERRLMIDWLDRAIDDFEK